MRAHEIMTPEVHTVKPDTCIADIARLMAAQRISGVPVVDDEGRMIGMVSETDLLHRIETGTERKRKWWISMFLDADMRARDFIKGHGRTAADVMSRFIISVPERAELAEVADILDVNNLKRVPVMNEGRLVGIITRGDLVRALAGAMATSTNQETSKDAAALQQVLNERIKRQSWLDTTYLNIVVADEAVELWGVIGSNDQHKALLILVREIAGDHKIVDHVIVGARRFGTAA